jgi:hypothetical protein
VRIEIRWRTSCGTTITNSSKTKRPQRYEEKNKKPLDASDLLSSPGPERRQGVARQSAARHIVYI